MSANKPKWSNIAPQSIMELPFPAFTMPADIEPMPAGYVPVVNSWAGISQKELDWKARAIKSNINWLLKQQKMRDAHAGGEPAREKPVEMEKSNQRSVISGYSSLACVGRLIEFSDAVGYVPGKW